jgi:hypothetical protein
MLNIVKMDAAANPDQSCLQIESTRALSSANSQRKASYGWKTTKSIVKLQTAFEFLTKFQHAVDIKSRSTFFGKTIHFS